ncbi:hypothetical protein ACA910_017582 [Epithemia clementina (nom. ined.)]
MTDPTLRPTILRAKNPTIQPTTIPTNAPSSQSPTEENAVIPTVQPHLTVPPRPSTSPTPRPTNSQESWIMPAVTTITGPDQASHFGTSAVLSSNGKVLAVGAPAHLSRRGEVRVYHSSAVQQDQWVTVAIFTSGSDLKETFGFEVALSSDGFFLP